MPASPQQVARLAELNAIQSGARARLLAATNRLIPTLGAEQLGLMQNVLDEAGHMAEAARRQHDLVGEMLREARR